MGVCACMYVCVCVCVHTLKFLANGALSIRQYVWPDVYLYCGCYDINMRLPKLILYTKGQLSQGDNPHRPQTH